jgi:branched-chain amino acid aminotransferase
MSHQITIDKSSQSRLHTVDFNNIPFGEVFSDHMFISDYRNGEWTDARIVPYAPISMFPSNLALHYGQSVFEGMKATKDIHGNPMLFRPEMHAKRINRSAARMCMPSFPEDLFLNALHELVDLDADWIPPHKGSALYIRPFIFATDEILGVKVSKTYKMIIFTGPVGPYYPKPVSLLAETKYVRAVKGGVGEAKAAGNYGAAMLPANLAQQKGYDQILWLDAIEHKYIQEVGTMNIFFNIDGQILTPETDGAILHGITRDSILHILGKEQINHEVRRIKIDEIVEAHQSGLLREIFGSGTAAVIARVSSFTYQDKTYSFDLNNLENSVAEYLKEEINGIRSGEKEDKYGWLVPVNSSSLV